MCVPVWADVLSGGSRRFDPRCCSFSCISAQFRDHFLACQAELMLTELVLCVVIAWLWGDVDPAVIQPGPQSDHPHSLFYLQESQNPWEGLTTHPWSLCYSCSELCSPGSLLATILYIFYFSEMAFSSLLVVSFFPFVS